MATINELMRGKKPGEIKIRRIGWPVGSSLRVISASPWCFEFCDLVLGARGVVLDIAPTATDWVIVTDAKRRRG